MFGPNTQNFKSKMAGFSLPGVLVGVALIGISGAIISQTVVNSRRTQKAVDLKLTSNKFQQAALDAVTERVKEFVLEDCFGARWGGSGIEVEKAFRELPLMTDSGVATNLKFTRSAGSLDDSELQGRCQKPVGPGVMGSGQYMSFCMEITPTGSPQIDYRLLELLIVPVDLASDQPKSCSLARGAAAGIKVTWQMYNQMDNKKVNGSGSGKTIMKESGVFLVSMETESYSGTCKVDAKRVGTTNQCKIDVSGLGRRPPKLFKNGTPMTGFSWERAAPDVYDAFKATVMCETNLVSTFRVQSAEGGDHCNSQAVPAVWVNVTLSMDRYPDGAKNTNCVTAMLLPNGSPVSLGCNKGVLAKDVQITVRGDTCNTLRLYFTTSGGWGAKPFDSSQAGRVNGSVGPGFRINRSGLRGIYIYANDNSDNSWTDLSLLATPPVDRDDIKFTIENSSLPCI